MQQAGTESWRFAESVPTFAHVALFVRDALRLETGSQAVPPRPVRDVPDLSQRLDPAIRGQAGAEWAGWWEAVIRLEAGVEGAGHGPGPALARARRQDLAFDPPEWDSLADRTGLRRAVVAAYEEGRSDQVRQSLVLRRVPLLLFGYEAVRRAAETVAAQAAVRPGSLNASATVIEVRGMWWELLAPGQLLCSVEVATSADSHLALTQVFRSLA